MLEGPRCELPVLLCCDARAAPADALRRRAPASKDDAQAPVDDVLMAVKIWARGCSSWESEVADGRGEDAHADREDRAPGADDSEDGFAYWRACLYSAAVCRVSALGVTACSGAWSLRERWEREREVQRCAESERRAQLVHPRRTSVQSAAPSERAEKAVAK